MQKAQAFYDTYLAWLYVRPAPDAVSGRRVLKARLTKGTGERREKKLKRDASVAADDSDEEPLQPLRILREFWSPDVYGLQRFCQRLFQVEFNDGSKQTLVAEDLLDGWDEPFSSSGGVALQSCHALSSHLRLQFLWNTARIISLDLKQNY